MDSRLDMVARVVAAVLTVALSAHCLACLYSMAQADATAETESAEPYEETYVPGQPLDMVRMTAPSWSSCDYMFRIVDRTSGACWLRIQMDGAWETWPVCEGRSYVAQQVASPAPAGEGAE